MDPGAVLDGEAAVRLVHRVGKLDTSSVASGQLDDLLAHIEHETRPSLKTVDDLDAAATEVHQKFATTIERVIGLLLRVGTGYATGNNGGGGTSALRFECEDAAETLLTDFNAYLTAVKKLVLHIRRCGLGLDDVVTNVCLNHLARGPPTAPFYIVEGGGGIERADVEINGDVTPRPQDPPVRLQKVQLFY